MNKNKHKSLRLCNRKKSSETMLKKPKIKLYHYRKKLILNKYFINSK